MNLPITTVTLKEKLYLGSIKINLKLKIMHFYKIAKKILHVF